MKTEKSRKISKKLAQKLSKIKVILTDVDGVLTDGGMYYTADGLVMKKFQVKDGMGSHLLRNAGYKTGIITTDVTPIAQIRGERLKMDFVHIGVPDKLTLVSRIADENNLTLENIAFIGDDVNDFGLLSQVGVSCAPADAVPRIKEIVDIVTERRGGKGAYREFASFFLGENPEQFL